MYNCSGERWIMATFSTYMAYESLERERSEIVVMFRYRSEGMKNHRSTN